MCNLYCHINDPTEELFPKTKKVALFPNFSSYSGYLICQ